MSLPRAAVVMAGGSGERFWPLSTPGKPKQLLDLTGAGKSLLEQSIERARPVFGDQIYVSTSLRLAPAIVESGLVPEDHVLAEPEKRNTLGALIWSMARLEERFEGDFSVAVLTADHRIHPTDVFQKTCVAALELAESSQGLVTLGIRPTRPETGYGYIEQGIGSRVARFREKPNQETAEEFFASGRFLWNSGMFFWTRDVFARELAAAEAGWLDIMRDKIRFDELPSLSVDVALFERSHQVFVIPAEFAWDDLGSWDSLRRTAPMDVARNAVLGAARLVESRNCIICNQTSKQTVHTLGLDDVVIVATDTDIVVLPVEKAQDVRKLANPS